MTRTRRDPFPLFLQRLLIAESKQRGRGVFSDSRRRSCGSCWNMVHNAAMEVRSGILTIRVKMWEILYMKARNCCVKIVLWLLCPVYGKFKRSVSCRNKSKYEEDSFSVFIQRLTYSTIPITLSVSVHWCFEFMMKKGYISAHKSRGWQCHYNEEYSTFRDVF